MTIIEAILVGLLQGLTEFLPISSSAHLRLAGPFLTSGDPGAAFTAVIQIGTEAAVLLYFRKDIWRIADAWIRQLLPAAENRNPADVRMGWLIIIGTLPIAILGVLFKDAIDPEGQRIWARRAVAETTPRSDRVCWACSHADE